jgi:hypothetical protein
MILPQLTFFCQLNPDDLHELFMSPAVIDGLKDLKANLSLGLLDFSQERANVVRSLNAAGIPLNAWLLLPEEDGYWFNLDNVPQALACYRAFREWTDENSLLWSGVALDIEPDIQDWERWKTGRFQLLTALVKRSFNRKRLLRAQAAYAKLAATIRSDGYFVESYQFPFIEDERKVGSTLLRRLAGLVDIPVDREVWMLYTSFFRPAGAGYLWSYAQQAKAIGLGSTGGGVDTGVGDGHPLDWEEFSRDLRLAWYWTNDIYIFSLEGCVHQGFFERLKNFQWDRPILFPDEVAEPVERWRQALRSALWVSHNALVIFVSTITAVIILRRLRALLRRR